MPLVTCENWRIAIINYACRFDEACFVQMERHLLTDEVFMLASGSATLVVGEKQKHYQMEKRKAYNVKKTVWHHIFVSKNACVIVFEKDSTSKENTEYLKL